MLPIEARTSSGFGLAAALALMWSALAACIDVAHASLMAAWVLGLPLLFWRRWPKTTRAYAIYAHRVRRRSTWPRGSCWASAFLTTLAPACWQEAARGSGHATVPQEWSTVRMAEAVFRLTPTHRGIKRASEALIFVTAIGVLAGDLALATPSASRSRRRRSGRRGEARDGSASPVSHETDEDDDGQGAEEAERRVTLLAGRDLFARARRPRAARAFTIRRALNISRCESTSSTDHAGELAVEPPLREPHRRERDEDDARHDLHEDRRAARSG